MNNTPEVDGPQDEILTNDEWLELLSRGARSPEDMADFLRDCKNLLYEIWLDACPTQASPHCLVDSELIDRAYRLFYPRKKTGQTTDHQALSEDDNTDGDGNVWMDEYGDVKCPVCDLIFHPKEPTVTECPRCNVDTKNW